MNKQAQAYIALVFSMAVGVAVLLVHPVAELTSHIVDWSTFGQLFVFAVVGLAAEFMAVDFRIGGAAQKAPRSSLAFLPFVSSLVLFPTPLAVASIVGVVAISQIFLRRAEFARVVFNVSQSLLCAGSAGMVYTHYASSGPGVHGFAFILLVLVFFSANVLLNSVGIALVNEIPLSNVLTKVAGPAGANLLYDVLASPIALIVVLLYDRIFVLSLLIVVTPLFLIRHSYKSAIELLAANEDLLTVLVKAIETRDPYTSGHSLRVSAMARRIASDLGRPEKEVAQIERAALLHDIGKIDADLAAVLRKPHELTPEERKLIQTHAVRGAELLQSLSSVGANVVAAVRHHHERFDGAGYPDGLAGSAIPLPARIIMICDSVDAMLSDRPYRKALSVGIVEEELKRCSGSQFDPVIVEVMLHKHTLTRAVDLVSTAKAAAPLVNMASVGA